MDVPRYVLVHSPLVGPTVGKGGQSGYGERRWERWGPLLPSTPPAPLRCRRWRGDDARERATNHFPGPGFILPRPPNPHRLEPFHIRRGSSDDFPLGALTLAPCLSDAACVPSIVRKRSPARERRRGRRARPARPRVVQRFQRAPRSWHCHSRRTGQGCRAEEWPRAWDPGWPW